MPPVALCAKMWARCRDIQGMPGEPLPLRPKGQGREQLSEPRRQNHAERVFLNHLLRPTDVHVPQRRPRFTPLLSSLPPCLSSLAHLPVGPSLLYAEGWGEASREGMRILWCWLFGPAAGPQSGKRRGEGSRGGGARRRRWGWGPSRVLPGVLVFRKPAFLPAMALCPPLSPRALSWTSTRGSLGSHPQLDSFWRSTAACQGHLMTPY